MEIFVTIWDAFISWLNPFDLWDTYYRLHDPQPVGGWGAYDAANGRRAQNIGEGLIIWLFTTALPLYAIPSLHIYFREFENPKAKDFWTKAAKKMGPFVFPFWYGFGVWFNKAKKKENKNA
jgi:hypothetical protein